MGLDADHRSLCNIDISEASYVELCDYIAKALQDARKHISTGSPECKLSLPRNFGREINHLKIRHLQYWIL